MTDLTYFSQYGKMTDPDTYAHLYRDLPDTVAELVAVVQGLLVHVFWAERYGLHLSEAQQNEVQLRTTVNRLARILELDPSPLTVARPPDKKSVGNCRDFSVTLASFLQAKGIPARPRCGFGAYFLPNHFEDHWVCEYWNAEQARWLLVDAQLDALQCGVLKIPFNPLDVPRAQFIVGGAAWQLCRSHQADPEQFGIFDMHGIDFVKGDFIRDVAALNKMELLPWDCWGLIELDYVTLTPADLAMLDHLADLTCADVPDFESVRQLYEGDPRLRVGKRVHSYIKTGMTEIKLP